MFRGPVKWRGSVEVDSLSKRTWSLSAFSEICAHVGIRVQVDKQGQACVVGQVAYRRDDRVVVSDENKAALGDLVDTLLAQILGSVAGELRWRSTDTNGGRSCTRSRHRTARGTSGRQCGSGWCGDVAGKAQGVG